VSIQNANIFNYYKKFDRIENLPPDKREIVLSLLRQQSPKFIAAEIQSWGFCLDIKEISLAHLLEEYRQKKIPIQELVNPFVVSKLTSGLSRNINVIHELSETILLQKERLREARLVELEDGVPLPVTDKMIQLLLRSLKIYGDVASKSGLLQFFADNFKRESIDENEYLEEEVNRLIRVLLGNIIDIEMKAKDELEKILD